MQLTFFSRTGWQDWDVAAKPAIADRVPQLVDDDLIFENAGVPRPSVAANRWLRELPVSGAAAPSTWAKYARALRDWMTFLAVLGIALFDTRDRLKQALGAYAAHRASGPVEARWAATTWNRTWFASFSRKLTSRAWWDSQAQSKRTVFPLGQLESVLELNHRSEERRVGQEWRY